MTPVFTHFVLSHASANTASQNIGGRIHGPSPHLKLWGDLPRRPIYRISPSISREISDNFENANLGVRPILGSRKMSSLTTRQATNMFANESSFVAADKFSEQ